MKWFPGDPDEGPEIRCDGEDVYGTVGEAPTGGCSSDPDDIDMGDEDD